MFPKTANKGTVHTPSPSNVLALVKAALWLGDESTTSGQHELGDGVAGVSMTASAYGYRRNSSLCHKTLDMPTTMV